MPSLTPPNLKEIFSEDFRQTESQFVSDINRYLVDGTQYNFLQTNHLTIGDLLNGRFSGKFNAEVCEIFKEWNRKIGNEVFKSSLFE